MWLFAGLCRLQWLAKAAYRYPVDTIGLFALTVGIVLILANALFLQAGAHPAPISKAPPRVILPDSPPPSQKASTGAATQARDPAAAERPRTQVIGDIQRQLSRRGFYDGAVDGVYGPKMDAAIRDFEQAIGARPNGEPSEALLRSIMKSNVSAKDRAGQSGRVDIRRDHTGSVPKVVAIQRALSDHGYGQLQPSGTIDGDTRAAIEKFERERRLPVTGQVSGRLSRELAAVTGRPLD